jgi:hypothetical protein
VLDNLLILSLSSLGLLVLGVLATGITVVLLPEQYFARARRPWWRHPGPWRGPELAKTAAKNLAGFVLVAIGAVLSVPGVPGPGLLTVFIGLFLVDFPGKYRLQCWILRRRHVNRLVHRLRLRFGRPPLAFPES